RLHDLLDQARQMVGGQVAERIGADQQGAGGGIVTVAHPCSFRKWLSTVKFTIRSPFSLVLFLSRSGILSQPLKDPGDPEPRFVCPAGFRRLSRGEARRSRRGVRATGAR